MLFTHDTEVALRRRRPRQHHARIAARRPTTSDRRRPRRVRALDRTGAGPGAPTATPPSSTAVRALRPRLRGSGPLDEAAAVDLVNALLAEARALPQLRRPRRRGPGTCTPRRRRPRWPPRMAVEAAMAIVDVIRAGELDRLRVCDGGDCEDVVVDLSKNRSRRFCDGGCGNRANVAAYRARKGDA